MEEQASDMGWHVIAGEDLLAALHRCANGEDPEMVYIELYANAEHHHPGEDDDECQG